MEELEAMFFDDSSSDDDDEYLIALALMADIESNKRPKRGGAMPGHAMVHRKTQLGHEKLMEDYFVENPVFGPSTFRRRFRMSRDLFLRIAKEVESHCPYFVQKRNATGLLGHTALKKIAVAVRMLAYGCPADSLDDWIHIGESTVIKSLKLFVKSVIEIYGEKYLREPNAEDTARLMEMGAARGFPGMLGSIDCMHWKWKLCPTALHGQFTGHCHDPTIILEVVASRET